MKKTLFTLMIFLPFIALGQDNLQSEMELTDHPLSKASYDLERNVETILIDDRNFSKSLINFEVNKSYSLTFTDKNKRLFRLIEKKDSDERLLESEPFLDLKWQIITN